MPGNGAGVVELCSCQMRRARHGVSHAGAGAASCDTAGTAKLVAQQALFWSHSALTCSVCLAALTSRLRWTQSWLDVHFCNLLCIVEAAFGRAMPSEPPLCRSCVRGPRRSCCKRRVGLCPCLWVPCSIGLRVREFAWKTIYFSAFFSLCAKFSPFSLQRFDHNVGWIIGSA